MILTERQSHMLERLLLTDDMLTAKILSEEFRVSVRTVRYDLENIEYWLEKRGAELKKVPRIGMKVIHKKNAVKALENMNLGARNVVFSFEERKIILLKELIYSDNIVTSDQLSETLMVSRSTVLNTIKQINEEIEEYEVVIEGIPHYGFILGGEEEAVRLYIMEIFVELVIKSYGNEILDKQRRILNGIQIDKIKDIIKQAKKEFNIRLTEIQEIKLTLKILAFVKRIKKDKTFADKNENFTIYKTTRIYSQANNIFCWIQQIYNIPYIEKEIAYFAHLLLSENVLAIANENYEIDEDHLTKVVAQIIQYVHEHLNIKENELETLHTELINHLRLTLKRYELNIVSKNPILEQIKAKYGDVFEVARKASKVFLDFYSFELSEDEIGFMTMYFVKSLEKSKTFIKKNIVVVCNTSKGTSELLATRIRNNIPEVNIKNIVSVIDIEKDKELLDEIDLVVSTIKIKNLNKPTIIVSPIITLYELSKIRDFLYLEGEYCGEEDSTDDYIDEALTNIMKKYIPQKNINPFYEEIKNLYMAGESSKNDVKKEHSQLLEHEFTGLILVEFGEMFQKLYPYGLNMEDFKKFYGLIIHLMMAIPRWKKGVFTEEKQISHYEKHHLKLFRMIEGTFKNINDKYNLNISKTEIISILRYLI